MYLFILQANPPPIIVNADSLDAGPYVSICCFSDYATSSPCLPCGIICLNLTLPSRCVCEIIRADKMLSHKRKSPFILIGTPGHLLIYVV